MTTALRPSVADIGVVARLVSQTLLAVSLTMLIPAAVAVVLGEWESVAVMVIGASSGLILCGIADRLLPSTDDVTWGDGMVAAGMVWLVAPVLCAIPLHLSGHFPSFLHAYFDAMSALTCAGLSVIHDLDHLPDSLNLWRHLMQFLGGQGIVLVVLTFFAGGEGAVGMYAGEGREDKILPNVRRSAQFIWRASLVYLLLGGTMIALALMADGMAVRQAVLHAVNLFFAAFDTGGFAPRSTSVAYYHSALVEALIILMMVAGAISFAVHFRLWQGDWREIVKNIELRVLGVTSTALMGLIALGLVSDGVHTTWVATMRRGFFQLVSAHTGAGFSTVSPGAFAGAWGQLAPMALVAAMAIGGMAGSTTGGIKAIRVGLVGRVLTGLLRRAAMPPDAHTQVIYHHLGPKRVQPQAVRAATTILLLFLLLYLSGTAMGLYHGYGLQLSLFESTSAAGGVGLSAGLTSPDMPTSLMVTYIGQMYLGRLEFVSAFALVGYAGSMVRR